MAKLSAERLAEYRAIADEEPMSGGIALSRTGFFALLDHIDAIEAEYAAWIEELEGPTPQELIQRAEAAEARVKELEANLELTKQANAERMKCEIAKTAHIEPMLCKIRNFLLTSEEGKKFEGLIVDAMAGIRR